jgi:hypothetical protein
MKKTVFGKKLIEALTIDEVVQLLDGLLSSMDKLHIKQVLSNLNNENIEEIISQLIFSEELTNVVSDNKFIQEWRELWNSWTDCVWKLGDEEEAYVYQDNDWETPYFVSNEFAEDLEKIAVKMLPFLDRITQMQEEEEDFFEEALREIESGIMGYPEWLGAEYADCYVGVSVTECMVKWAWVNADSVETFLNRLIKTEERLNIISLDSEGYINTLNELSEDNKKEIYDYINLNKATPAWKERLDSTRCIWHKIYHDFSSLFDQESHLETCRKLLYDNWEYSGPQCQDSFLLNLSVKFG